MGWWWWWWWSRRTESRQKGRHRGVTWACTTAADVRTVGLRGNQPMALSPRAHLRTVQRLLVRFLVNLQRVLPFPQLLRQRCYCLGLTCNLRGRGGGGGMGHMTHREGALHAASWSHRLLAAHALVRQRQRAARARDCSGEGLRWGMGAATTGASVPPLLPPPPGPAIGPAPSSALLHPWVHDIDTAQPPPMSALSTTQHKHTRCTRTLAAPPIDRTQHTGCQRPQAYTFQRPPPPQYHPCPHLPCRHPGYVWQRIGAPRRLCGPD